ncbi:phenylacetic acid degradation operon negative regulatory protein PaaX [Bacillus sp. FJAT-50079]|uniref:phenylacetic acid degradation operon negative regulatory protein PaaX n=1 Tax=Bacillus sp. FJAT-50079 TaxID=2833577 RepID=UPI001BC967EF|nr:phenylacetic acid degradation operon negative regulatory protein PaaX [Bacillus sp. FJAT-50079]MBS4210750.1 phenylacetic acid degradation operon negative regulatory protein PaaX [Bacillus sp. FJAT-50079]
MRNGPNTRSLIFTLFGDYIRHSGNEIWIGSLIRLMKEFGHNDQSVRTAVSRMYKQGWLVSSKIGNRSYYRLTDRGMARMEEAGKRIFKLKPDQWDGNWRMLFYSIPEEKRSIRDDLKKELSWSGFAPLSGSCWITPNNLTEETKQLIKKYQLEKYVDFFTADYEGPKQNIRLVQSCWNLTDISNKYKQFIDEYTKKFNMTRRKCEQKSITNAQCFVEKTMLVHEYRKFLFIDPGLPAELLPEDWIGYDAAQLFSVYYKLLAPPAITFYENVFKEGNTSKETSRSYDLYEQPLLIAEDEPPSK